MAHINFNPITPSISIRFRCNQCSNIISTEFFDIPSPNWHAETHHDSISTEIHEYECPHCAKTYEITLNNGFFGGDGEISDIDEVDIYNVEEYTEYDPEWELEYVEKHVRDIIKVLEAIESIDELSKKILHKNLYANVIAVMEAFLYNTLRAEVLSKDDAKRLFVKNYELFSKSKISISEIFFEYDNIDKTIINELNKLLYHNLDKIKGIFMTTLKIDIGDISELSKCVSIRHDIVHRNGIDKNGNEHLIGKSQIIHLSNLVGQLITTVENQLNQNRQNTFEEIHECDTLAYNDSPFD